MKLAIHEIMPLRAVLLPGPIGVVSNMQAVWVSSKSALVLGTYTIRDQLGVQTHRDAESDARWIAKRLNIETALICDPSSIDCPVDFCLDNWRPGQPLEFKAHTDHYWRHRALLAEQRLANQQLLGASMASQIKHRNRTLGG